jgi:hypothetical protein
VSASKALACAAQPRAGGERFRVGAGEDGHGRTWRARARGRGVRAGRRTEDTAAVAVRGAACAPAWEQLRDTVHWHRVPGALAFFDRWPLGQTNPLSRSGFLSRFFTFFLQDTFFSLLWK